MIAVLYNFNPTFDYPLKTAISKEVSIGNDGVNLPVVRWKYVYIADNSDKL